MRWLQLYGSVLYNFEKFRFRMALLWSRYRTNPSYGFPCVANVDLRGYRYNCWTVDLSHASISTIARCEAAIH